MDITALFQLSYGLYVIGTKDGERNVGCVVNTVTQSTANPVTLTVCVHKDNYTNGCIKRAKAFAVSILSEKTKPKVFGAFGFSSGKEKDKFEGMEFGESNSMPYLKEGVTGFLQCKVIDCIENFTHTVFIAEVVEAENLTQEPPMTYAYYHKVIKGKTPKKASSYVEEVKEAPKAQELASGYVCTVCSYRFPGTKEEFEARKGFICPVCAVPKSKFVLR